MTNQHQGYGFVEFRSEEDADYVSLLQYCTMGNMLFVNHTCELIHSMVCLDGWDRGGRNEMECNRMK